VPASRRKSGDRALLLGAFVIMASTTVVFPLIAELQDAHELPTAGLGLIAAGPFFAGFAVQALFAGYADRGRARLLMTLGLTLAAVSLFGMAAGTTLPQFVAARTVSGLAIGLFFPAARALAAHGAGTRTAHELGRLSSAELAGTVLGPVSGAAVASAFGLVTAFVAFGVATLVVTAAVAPSFREAPAGDGSIGSDEAGIDEDGRERDDAKGLAAISVAAAPSSAIGRSVSLLRSNAVCAALLLVVAIEFPIGMYESMFASYLTDRGASAIFIGAMAAIFGAPFVILASRGGRLADRVGPVRAATTASLIVAPIIAAYGFPSRPGVIAALTVVEACFQAVAIPASRAAMVYASPPGQVAAGQGLSGAAGLLATGCTALASPVLYELGGSRLMCSTIGAGVALCVLGALYLGRREPVAAPA
jgi:DHA1 family multidrug resistance protein-like MFS transporter